MGGEGQTGQLDGLQVVSGSRFDCSVICMVDWMRQPLLHIILLSLLKATGEPQQVPPSFDNLSYGLLCPISISPRNTIQFIVNEKYFMQIKYNFFCQISIKRWIFARGSLQFILMVNIQSCSQQFSRGCTACTFDAFWRVLLMIIISLATIYERDKLIALYYNLGMLINSSIRSLVGSPRNMLHGECGTVFQAIQGQRPCQLPRQILRIIQNDKRLLQNYETLKQLYGNTGKEPGRIKQLNTIIYQLYVSQAHLFFFQNFGQAPDSTCQCISLSYIQSKWAQTRNPYQQYTQKGLLSLLAIITLPVSSPYISAKHEKANREQENHLSQQQRMVRKIGLEQMQKKKKVLRHLNIRKIVNLVNSQNRHLCNLNGILITDSNFINNGQRSNFDLLPYLDLKLQIRQAYCLQWASIFKDISKFIQEAFTKVNNFRQLQFIQKIVFVIFKFLQYTQFSYQKIIILIEQVVWFITQTFLSNSPQLVDAVHNKNLQLIDNNIYETQSTQQSQNQSMLQQFLYKSSQQQQQYLQDIIHKVQYYSKGLDNFKKMIEDHLQRLQQSQIQIIEIVQNIIRQPPTFFNSKLEPIRKIKLIYKNGHSKAISFKQSDNSCLISKDDDNSSVCSSIYLDFDADLNEEHSFIGVLITIKKSDQQVSASTAFLINNRTLVTCIHAFQNDMRDFTTTSIIFVPNCVNSFKTFRYTASISKEDVHTTNRDPDYSYKNVGRQLAMLSLSEPIRLGIRVPRCASYEEMDSKKVFIVGYPLSQIKYSFMRESIVEEKNAHIDRQQYEADYVNIDPAYNIIQHNLPTQAGVSGAPIMARKRDNPKEVIIIGIHTHGARLKGFYNMGLLFTKEIIEKIDAFVRENQEKHSGSEDEVDSREFEDYAASKCPQNEVLTNCDKQT